MDFYRDFNITLTSGEIRFIAAYGSYLTILDNNTATDLVVSLNGNAGQPIPSGVSVELPANTQYSGFYIQNTSGGNMTVRFAISAGRIVDSRLKAASTLNVNVLSGTITDLTSTKNNTRALNGDTGTQILKYGTANNSTTTIHVVTAGKSLYLTSMFASTVSSSGSILSGDVIITNAADVLQHTLMSQYAFSVTAVGYVTANGASKSFLYPIKIPANYKVKIVCPAGVYTNASIEGWEE